MESKRVQPKRHINYIYVGIFLLFFTNKFFLRPWTLGQDFPDWIKSIPLSLPNFIEAVAGVLIITALSLQYRIWFKKEKVIRDKAMYLFAFLFVGIYVILQEFKIHNLGGRNVYDPIDVIASILGLILIMIVLWKFGFDKNATESSRE